MLGGRKAPGRRSSSSAAKRIASGGLPMSWRTGLGFAVGAIALRELDKLVWQKANRSPSAAYTATAFPVWARTTPRPRRAMSRRGSQSLALVGGAPQRPDVHNHQQRDNERRCEPPGKPLGFHHNCLLRLWPPVLPQTFRAPSYLTLDTAKQDDRIIVFLLQRKTTATEP